MSSRSFNYLVSALLPMQDSQVDEVLRSNRSIAEFLSGYSKFDIHALPGIGEATVNAVNKHLNKYGFKYSTIDRTPEGRHARFLEADRKQKAMIDRSWVRCPTCSTKVHRSKLIKEMEA